MGLPLFCDGKATVLSRSELPNQPFLKLAPHAEKGGGVVDLMADGRTRLLDDTNIDVLRGGIL